MGRVSVQEHRGHVLFVSTVSTVSAVSIVFIVVLFVASLASILSGYSLSADGIVFLSNLCTAVPQVNRPATAITSDRDKSLHATGDEISRAQCGTSLPQRSKQLRSSSRALFNTSTRLELTETRLQVFALLPISFAHTESRLQAGFVELEASPPAATYAIQAWSCGRHPVSLGSGMGTAHLTFLNP